jgi:cation diffusion facilitator family transporter
MKSERPITIYAAAGANLLIAVAKFCAAAVTGSSAMVSEGIHSVVDTGNQLLLLLGLHASKKPPDELHPFGHGKELYFWSLIVAVVLFVGGGGFSIADGYHRLQNPEPMKDPLWNYIVLAVAAVAEGFSWTLALRKLRQHKPADQSHWRAVRDSKDPGVFVVLAEDTAALLGIAIAAVGVFMSHQFDLVVADGIASLLIGMVLLAVAWFLIGESRKLLLGEAADLSTRQAIRRIVLEDPTVVRAQPPLTMHLGPENILVYFGLEFRATASSADVADAIDRIEHRIRQQNPSIKQIFIEAEALRPKTGTAPAGDTPRSRGDRG